MALMASGFLLLLLLPTFPARDGWGIKIDEDVERGRVEVVESSASVLRRYLDLVDATWRLQIQFEKLDGVREQIPDVDRRVEGIDRTRDDWLRDISYGIGAEYELQCDDRAKYDALLEAARSPVEEREIIGKTANEVREVRLFRSSIETDSTVTFQIHFKTWTDRLFGGEGRRVEWPLKPKETRRKILIRGPEPEISEKDKEVYARSIAQKRLEVYCRKPIIEGLVGRMSQDLQKSPPPAFHGDTMRLYSLVKGYRLRPGETETGEAVTPLRLKAIFLDDLERQLWAGRADYHNSYGYAYYVLLLNEVLRCWRAERVVIVDKDDAELAQNEMKSELLRLTKAACLRFEACQEVDGGWHYMEPNASGSQDLSASGVIGFSLETSLDVLRPLISVDFLRRLQSVIEKKRALFDRFSEGQNYRSGIPYRLGSSRHETLIGNYFANCSSENVRFEELLEQLALRETAALRDQDTAYFYLFFSRTLAKMAFHLRIMSIAGGSGEKESETQRRIEDGLKNLRPEVTKIMRKYAHLLPEDPARGKPLPEDQKAWGWETFRSKNVWGAEAEEAGFLSLEQSFFLLILCNTYEFYAETR